MTAAGCETGDLLMIHRVLRTTFGRAPGLIARAMEDPRRMPVVDAHLDEITEALHRHHEGEDLSLWDRLEQRAPACALHVGRMRQQHATIGGHLEIVRTAHEAWKRDRRAGAAGLTSALEHLVSALEGHLADEEATIRPLAGTLLTQDEWNEMRDHGIAGTPKSRLLVQIGYLLRALDTEEERAEMLSALPAPARVMYRLFGERQLSKELVRLYGTDR